MESGLIERFGVSLALTIAVELTVAFLSGRVLWKCSGGRQLGKKVLLVTLVNVLTNPPAVLVCWIAGLYLTALPDLSVQLAVEAVVVAVEACVYCSFARNPQWEIRRPALLAVVANLCSWLTGAVFA